MLYPTPVKRQDLGRLQSSPPVRIRNVKFQQRAMDVPQSRETPFRRGTIHYPHRGLVALQSFISLSSQVHDPISLKLAQLPIPLPSQHPPSSLILPCRRLAPALPGRSHSDTPPSSSSLSSPLPALRSALPRVGTSQAERLLSLLLARRGSSRRLAVAFSFELRALILVVVVVGASVGGARQHIALWRGR